MNLQLRYRRKPCRILPIDTWVSFYAIKYLASNTLYSLINYVSNFQNVDPQLKPTNMIRFIYNNDKIADSRGVSQEFVR